MLKKEIFLLIACLIVAGCGGVMTNVMDAKLDGKSNIIINDSSLNRQVTFGGFKRDGTGVQVDLVNNTSRDISFEYRFLWYDANGIEISTVTNWNPSQLTGMESRGYRSTPPSESAVGFRLMLRKPHAITQY